MSDGVLERRLLAELLAFPQRLDAMETRDEEACRKLAAILARAAEETLAGARSLETPDGSQEDRS